MWLNVIRIFLFSHFLNLLSENQCCHCLQSKEKDKQQACDSHNCVLLRGGGHYSLSPSRPLCLLLPLLKLSCMWKLLKMDIGRSSLTSTTAAEIHSASGRGEFNPYSYGSFLTKWRCALRNRIPLTLYLPFMSTMNRIIL